MESIHARHYIHRDIKPDHFMTGVDDHIYLIDFGLAQNFRDPTTHVHIPLTTGNNLVGTIRYTSINSHMGLQQSRRDDLESLAYTVMHLLCRKLPWQGISLSHNTIRQSIVHHRKRELCQYNHDIIPSSLMTFVHYSRSLSFKEKPDYVYLHGLIKKLLA